MASLRTMVDGGFSTAHHEDMTDEYGPSPISARDRFVELLRKELLGCDVQLVNREMEATTQKAQIVRPLPNGQWLAVTTGPESPSLAALQRRLEVFLECFAHTLESSIPELDTPLRPPVPILLQGELQALSLRVQAVDTVVIDVQSPVIWCSAVAGSAVEGADDLDRSPMLDSKHSRIDRVRASMLQISKGGRTRHVFRDDDLLLVTRVFADIYVLIAAFETMTDEVLVERAIIRALPRIEQLVLALPPIDPIEPEPRRQAQVVRLKRG